jgi:xanthine/CO dehydrogenase XdhC/CoxF family maturation factor
LGAHFVALKTALEHPYALAEGYGYVVLAGGKQRPERLFCEALDTGVDPEEWRRPHGPAGLAVGAETPEGFAPAIVSGAPAVLGRQLIH